MRLPALIALIVILAAQPAAAGVGDVLIQAGHEGRPASCAPLHVKACNLGAAAGDARERDWTPRVADAAAAALRARGYRVIRRPADYAGEDTVRAALFLHFDGSAPCASGASVGFPEGTGRAFIAGWEHRYRALFPFRFVGENISVNERRYYGFRKVNAPEKLLIEFGEISCPEQRAWMAPRLTQLGTAVADFLTEALPR